MPPKKSSNYCSKKATLLHFKRRTITHIDYLYKKNSDWKSVPTLNKEKSLAKKLINLITCLNQGAICRSVLHNDGLQLALLLKSGLCTSIWPLHYNMAFVLQSGLWTPMWHLVLTDLWPTTGLLLPIWALVSNMAFEL